MEKIGIETTQNVFIEHEVANVGERIISAILDIVFMTTYLIIAIIIITNLKGLDFLIYILLLPVFLYSLISEIVFQGQSFGKKIMKIKVMRKDGAEPNIGNYLIRWLFRIIDVWMTNGGLAIITIIVNGHGQRLGDVAAGTIVVKLRMKRITIDSIYKKLEQTYTLVYPEVKLLSEDDINTINDVIKHHRKNRSETSLLLIKQTCNVISKKTGINYNTHPIVFLETIIKDYNYINRE